MSIGFTKVGQVNEFALGSLRRIQVAKDDVLIVNVDGKLYAIAASCTHRGGPLDEGELQGSTIICPWHGGQFDVTTGKATTPPPTTDAVSFEVKIDGSNVMLKRR